MPSSGFFKHLNALKGFCSPASLKAVLPAPYSPGMTYFSLNTQDKNVCVHTLSLLVVAVSSSHKTGYTEGKGWLYHLQDKVKKICDLISN